MAARHFIIVGSACLLVACAGSPNTRVPTPPTNPIALETTPSEAARATPEPARTPVRDTVRAAPGPAPTPASLIGLDSDNVDKLVGPPDLVRLDGPAEVRLYRAPKIGCTLHVFLYVKEGSAPTRAVEYYEARNQQGRLEGDDITNCYRALVAPAKIS